MANLTWFGLIWVEKSGTRIFSFIFVAKLFAIFYKKCKKYKNKWCKKMTKGVNRSKNRPFLGVFQNLKKVKKHDFLWFLVLSSLRTETLRFTFFTKNFFTWKKVFKKFEIFEKSDFHVWFLWCKKSHRHLNKGFGDLRFRAFSVPKKTLKKHLKKRPFFKGPEKTCFFTFCNKNVTWGFVCKK